MAIDGRVAIDGRTSTDTALPGLNFGPVAIEAALGAADDAVHDSEGAVSAETASPALGSVLAIVALGAAVGKPATGAAASALWANASLGAE